MCCNGHGALYTWTVGACDRVMRRPYRCVSWRHAGPCARREAAITFARIKEAVERPEFDPSGWVFVVLTLDRNGFFGGKPLHDVQAAFRELSRLSRNFLARVRRLCERNGWTNPGSHWVATVEAHRSGRARSSETGTVRHRAAARVLQAQHRDDAVARASSRKLPLPASPAFALRASAFAKATADKTAGRLLRIHVERFNPALRLYERLGFRQIDDRGVYLFMEWVNDNSQRPNDPTIQGKRFDTMG